MDEDKIIIIPEKYYMDSLIIKSSKESKYGQCFCCCLLILMAFICKEEGLFAVCLIAALILLRVAMLSNEILILQANGLTVKRGKKERIYKWDEFCNKLVVKAKGERGRSKYINFSKYKYICNNTYVYRYIVQKDGCFYDCIDEEIVAEKLKEWHVELSGDNLGKLPWNE